MSNQPGAEAAAPRRPAGAITPFFAVSDPSRRWPAGVLQLGLTSAALWIASLYPAWDDQTGALVKDPVNLWFNCVTLAAYVLMLWCVWRPGHRMAGAVALCGFTVGMFPAITEDAFGMFTYNDATPGAGFWLGLSSYVLQLGAAGYAAYVSCPEWGVGRAPARGGSTNLMMGFASYDGVCL